MARSDVRRCDNCSAWSNLVAESRPEGVRAMCLNQQSPDHTKMTLDRHACLRWSDDPRLSDL